MIDRSRIVDSFAKCAELFRDQHPQDTRLHYCMASRAISCNSHDALGCSVRS